MNNEYVSAVYTWGQFAPEFALVALATLILMADCFAPRIPKRVYPIVGAVGAFIAAFFMIRPEFGYSSPFGMIACVTTALVLLLAYDYRKVTCASVGGAGVEEGTTELCSLLLIACAGVCALAEAHDIIMLFVSLEVVTLASYVMAGYFRRNQGSVEAGVKYLVLGALSTGLMVFGAAWYYGTTGSFMLSAELVHSLLTCPMTELQTGFYLAVGLLLLGAFFKAGAAPMQIWIPDVYQGSPTPVSAFLAVASKAAGFAVLVAILLPFSRLYAVHPGKVGAIVTAISVVAAATLLVGNLGAICQNNAKRLLGYSSIGQAGFILVFFTNIGATCLTDYVVNYLVAYMLATVAAFYAIAMVRTQRGSEEIAAFRGLGKTNPRTAFLITVSFASLAGVPLTYGFLAKYNSFAMFIEATHCQSGLIWLLPFMIVGAAAGFYYYFKVLREMYWEKPQEGDKPLQVPVITAAVLTGCALVLIWLGTEPLMFIPY
ncbi:MAG: NADH-quinone oxidoreductase subunit N [Akkermansia sp.]|nr:NADH-quinone oxidoreductase subunit N [Akkermansia sp.]